MELENFLKNPDSQTALYNYALSLYSNKNNKELEKLFTKHLKKSYDLNFWDLYVDYVKKVSVKKVNLTSVYSFVLDHFEHSWKVYPVVHDYISELGNIEDDSLRSGEIRKAYHRALSIPMHNIHLLWSEYEKWENSTNKPVARSMIEQIQPLYANAASLYQRLSPYIQNDNFFGFLDIELENGLKLSKADFAARLNFIFNYYINKFPDSEALYFLKSFYSNDDKEPGNAQMSLFLSTWYSFLYKKNLFNFDDQKNFELICINYFNWLIKNEGMEAFRLKFQEVKDRIGAHAYIYAATAEFHQGGSPKIAYQVFQEAFALHPENSLVCEEFFKFFIRIGDDDNVRPLFKKLRKTEEMWNMMIDYEFMNGEIEEYKNLLLQKNEAIKRQELLPKTEPTALRKKNHGTLGVYENVMWSFGYLNLEFKASDTISEFIASLPELCHEENILANLDNNEVVELLQMVE